MSPSPRSRTGEVAVVGFMLGCSLIVQIARWPPQHTVDWVLLVFFVMLASSAAVWGTVVMRRQRRAQHERRSEEVP